MESPGLESPLDGDDIFPCKGCGEILEEGKAFELAGNRWHLDCFRCNTCHTLLDSDANLLLLGDGSLICNNCTYSCHSCHNKIEDLAILTGDQAYCASCFRCRNCKRKIENLRYARTSQGIFCMSCHESLMARRRKKSKAAAQSRSVNKEKEEKSLPALPHSALPQSAFNPAPDATSKESETPTELSPRPHATTFPKDNSSRSSSRRPPDALERADTALKESLTLPSTTYRTTKSSAPTQSAGENSDTNGFTPSPGLDSGSNPALTPRAGTFERQDNRQAGRDHIAANKNAGRSLRDQDQEPAFNSPHIAYQDKGRQNSGESAMRTLQPSPDLTSDSFRAGNGRNGSPAGVTSPADQFRRQEVPKNKRAPSSRSTSAADINAAAIASTNAAKQAGLLRKDNSGTPQWPDSQRDMLSPERSGLPRSSQDSRPSIDSGTSRNDIKRKEVSKIGNSTSTQELSSSASSVETPSSTPTVNGKSISGPLISPNDDLIVPSRASGRAGPPGQTTGDSFTAPRAPPPPPTAGHHHKPSVASTIEQPPSPKLPRWSSGGDFTMEEDMARILGGNKIAEDEGFGKSIKRRVSNAVRHARQGSDPGRGHARSISETTRGTGSPRWPKTPIVEDPEREANPRNISSPMLINSPHADIEILRKQLRDAEVKIADYERSSAEGADVQALNKKLIEKRKTVTVLDTQAELMLRQIETLAETVEHAKATENFDMRKAQEKSLTDFKRKLDHLQQSLTQQVETLIEERDALEDSKLKAQAERDRALLEFEQLASKNAQLTEMNNDLTHQIQERFKAQSGAVDSPRPQNNGLGIYTQHSKNRSMTSVHDDMSMRPSTSTTLQGSAMGSVSGYTQNSHDLDMGLESATILEAPRVVDMKGNKQSRGNFWKASAGVITKAKNKGLKFGSDKHMAGGYQPAIGDNIGIPYDATRAGGEAPSTTSLPRSTSNDPARQANAPGWFGGNKKNGSGSKPSMASMLEGAPAEPPSKLFGSYLVERADFERAQIPFIVTRCIEEVQMRGMEVEGIYRRSGGRGQTDVVQAGFENSTEFDGVSDPDIDITAVTSVLKKYLGMLPNPLITIEVQDRVMLSKDTHDVEERCEYLREAFDLLPPKHRDCLEYLIFHLYQVVQKESINKMTAHNIAVVFAPTIMNPRDVQRELLETTQRNEVMMFVVTHCYDIFNAE